MYLAFVGSIVIDISLISIDSSYRSKSYNNDTNIKLYYLPF